jgi:uncharacterized glyoxalase superfamily protein PhnB
VGDLRAAVAHYRDRLAFDVRLLLPDDDPFFAIVGRDGMQILLKHIGHDVPPIPNPSRHAWARWDAFVHCDDPDALAAELKGRGVTPCEPLEDHDDGLRGFAVADADGYVLFFGRPIGS